ncbi:MAG: hypothetical protein HN392_08590 [Anaerolineae bacterium]|jgi:hypothetical protein|nr:hypothetical protein [Anaerolineae bacterium]MBT7074014.1 hypothetical protein [Anaerolineae bacterium]MBT7782025.1 hypothetical protein [Anaerolineae bacterium]
MLENLQKYAPTISILLLIVFLTALFFYPSSTRMLSGIVIIFGIGTAIIFTIHGNWQSHKREEITRTEFLRNTFIDLLGLMLVMGLAIFLGRLVGAYAGASWGIFAGIIVGMAVGFGVAFLIQKIWGKITIPLKA